MDKGDYSCMGTTEFEVILSFWQKKTTSTKNAAFKGQKIHKFVKDSSKRHFVLILGKYGDLTPVLNYVFCMILAKFHHMEGQACGNTELTSFQSPRN